MIDIICPLYKGSEYILPLYQSIKEQKGVNINEILFILTNTNDQSEEILKNNHINYEKIEKKDFSHSRTRERAGLKSKADILVFITQDIIIPSNLWLHNLTKDIISGRCDASYSRQIARDSSTIEKYTREKNYPENSYLVSKKDISGRGLNTFFFSDAASAVRKETFVKLNGYDNKDFPTNEDMYLAHKLIINGYKIKYAADSIIIHSHNFSLKELYHRYYAIGLFFKENSYLDGYGTNKSGSGMAKYILKRSLKEMNIPVLIRFFPDMIVRFIGMKMGRYCGK